MIYRLKWSLLIALLSLIMNGLRADDHSGHSQAPPAQSAKTKAKPYTLKTCLVSDEKFGGDMGEPYVFEHKDQQIKLCCKSCLKDFKKDTPKYLKKLEKLQKEQKSASPGAAPKN